MSEANAIVLPAYYDPRKRRPATPWRALAHIPGKRGLPFFGQTFEYLRDQTGYERKQAARFGTAYRQRTFFATSVTLLSLEAARQVLQDKSGIFSSTLGWDSLLGRYFAGGLMLRDFEDHRLHRKIMKEAFNRSALMSDLETMNPVIRTVVGQWGALRDFHFYRAAKALTLSLAGAVFLGLELGEEATRISNAFVDLMKAPFGLVHLSIPGTAHWRGLKGRAYLAALFQRLITQRRAAPRGELLSRLCQARDEAGEKFTDQEVVDHLVFLMMAAHDTTTSALTYLAFELAGRQEWQTRLREECAAIGSEVVTFADLERLELMDMVIKETLRLHPPVSAIPRRTLVDCEIDGHHIPADTIIWISPLWVHRLPNIWTDPDAFDPERFSEARAEHRRDPFCWIPFGGGAHTCLGLQFSTLQIKAVLHQLLLRYRLRLHPGYEPAHQMVPFPKPVDDLPMVLEPLS